MAGESDIHLTRRQRQIMDIIYRRGEASAQEVLEDLPDPPSYSAVRALLRILEEKGHLRHHKVAAKYVYQPTRSQQSAARSAIRRVVRTFFDDSAEKAVAALLESADSKLTDKQLHRLARRISQARKTGR